MPRGIALFVVLLTCVPLLAQTTTRPVKKRDPVLRPAGVEPFGEPLSYSGEFVEVSASHTLRSRYHSKDFQKDLDFYFARAQEASKNRTPGVIRIRQVLIKQINITGGVAEAVCKIPEKFITEVSEYEQTLGRTIFAYSNGALRVQWLKPVIIDSITYNTKKEDLGDKWWFRPKWAEEQILPHLKDMKEGDADFLMFFLHYAVRNDNGKQMWPAYGGMAWGHEEMLGARLLTLNDHEIARGTHELGHHWYDTTVQETEEMTITRNHGMTDAGYFADDVWDPKAMVGTLELGPVMQHYRDLMRHFYTRDMWERWRLRPPHKLPHESFSGKAYKWDDVKSDYWYKLPQLRKEELRKLTGLTNLTVNTGEAFVMFEPGEDGKVDSPLLDQPVQKDLALNNAINLKGESCAVLSTPTGVWLFVRPPLVDWYVDMDKIRNEAPRYGPVPVYGYVLDDLKGLLVLRLRDAGADVPDDELGFFTRDIAPISATGTVSPRSSVFRATILVGVGPLVISGVNRKAYRYTLDDTPVTDRSPVFPDRGLKIDKTTVVRAKMDGETREGRRKFIHQPIAATVEGVFGSAPPYTLAPAATVDLRVGPKLKIHYTLDGMTPTKDSPVYEKPLAINGAAVLSAQAFDTAGEPVGDVWSAGFVDRGYEKTLTTDKPVTYSDYEAQNNPADAVDGFADRDNGWWSKPGPTWMTVDLQAEHKVDRVNLVTYWDGGRYYQYTIEVSTDGKDWKKVVDASANTTAATKQGYSHQFEPTPARYIKVTMLKNSANPGLHVVELRAWEAK